MNSQFRGRLLRKPSRSPREDFWPKFSSLQYNLSLPKPLSAKTSLSRSSLSAENLLTSR